jgi:trehalose 6-phosphate synthase
VTFATIGLAQRDYDQYYRGFSNATLWPAFHYRPDLIQFDRDEFDGYCRVNRWLAKQLAPLLKADDVIWVHDYHLIPFAQALRDEGVTNRIGFFLHIPFPATQVLLSVPRHRVLVEALCSFDLLGFQTAPDSARVLRLHRDASEWLGRTHRWRAECGERVWQDAAGGGLSDRRLSR